MGIAVGIVGLVFAVPSAIGMAKQMIDMTLRKRDSANHKVMIPLLIGVALIITSIAIQ